MLNRRPYKILAVAMLVRIGVGLLLAMGLRSLGNPHQKLAKLAGALILLSLCTGLVCGSRHRTIIALTILMLVIATQVGCDNGSVPSSSGGPIMSTQSAGGATATAKDLTGESIPVGGFSRPILLSTIILAQLALDVSRRGSGLADQPSQVIDVTMSRF